MKQKIVLGLFGSLLFIIICGYTGGYAAQGGGDGTGATGSSGCSCHSSSNSISTIVELDSAGVAVTSYRPGLAYTVKISATNSSTSTLPKFGFQLATVKLTGAGTGSCVQAGTWGSTLPVNVQNTSTGTSGLPIPIIEHSSQISAASGTGGSGTIYIESIPWTAPATGTGSVKIYGVLNAVNNNNSSGGDKYHVATAVTITEAASAPPVVASVAISITGGSNPTCSGVPVTFTATPTNGGTTPTYVWKVNGTQVGTGSTYTSSTLANGSAVTCVMTSNLSGVTGSPATSPAINMTVTTSVTDSVNISASATTVCAGTSVTFTAHPFNGGTPTYVWKVNGTQVGTGSTYTSSTLATGSVVTCVMTPTGACVSPATATSNALTVTVNPILTDSVHISATATTICAGTSVTFTAIATNGGATPAYAWRVNGAQVGTGSSYSSSTLANNDVVTCVLTPSGACVSPATSTSNAISMTVNPTVVPTIHITTPSTSICTGSSATFTASVTNGGATPAYQWRVNGTNSGTNSPTFTTSALTNGQIVTCVLTSDAGCASPATVTSKGDTITVSSSITPTVTISGPTSICYGSADTITAQSVNGGSSPTYSWTVNSAAAGTNSNTLILPTVTNNAGISIVCTMTSNSACATVATVSSQPLVTGVIALVTPSIRIAAGRDTVCAGSYASFTAIESNGGNSPQIQWLVNNTLQTVTGATFATNTLANGDVVTSVLTSDAVCATTQQATSAGVTETVLPVPTAAATPSGAVTVCTGDSVLLTATGGVAYSWSNAAATSTVWAKNNGTYNVTVTDANGCSAIPATPTVVTLHSAAVPAITQSGNVLSTSAAISYVWLLNGTAIGGADTTQAITITQSGSYAVEITDASGCRATSPDSSIIYTGLSDISADLGVRLYPVPNHGTFMIDMKDYAQASVVIYDVYGNAVYRQPLTAAHQEISAGLPSALYFVQVLSGTRVQTIKMQVIRE